jgi:hypothetical protein
MMQKWEYKVFASHLDPAELVLILNDSGREGWELVALAAVIEQSEMSSIGQPRPSSKAKEAGEAVPVEAFRYIFKRPLH